MKKLLLLPMLALIFTSCKKDLISPSHQSSPNVMKNAVVQCGEPVVIGLKAGQTIEVGTISVSNDETNMYITVNTTDGWMFNESHIYMGVDPVPLNGGGNPAPGQFPFNNNHNYVTSYTRVIPRSLVQTNTTDCLYLAVHLSVGKIINGEFVQQETAWAEGTKFSGNRWGWYSNYCPQDCTPAEEEICLVSHTAWSFGTKFNTGGGQWGWSSPYTGVASSQPIYAGQNIPAGTVYFTPAGDQVNISIVLNAGVTLQNDNESVKIQGTNVALVGNQAPGQFTTYKGTSLNVTVDAKNFYAIHLDVNVPCESTPDSNIPTGNGETSGNGNNGNSGNKGNKGNKK